MATQSTTNRNERRGTGSHRGRAPSRQSIASEAQRYLDRGNEQLRGIVEDREGQTILTAMALGFGIGLAIGYAIGGPSREEHYGWDRRTAEGLGRKLLARLDQILPSSVSDRLHG